MVNDAKTTLPNPFLELEKSNYVVKISTIGNERSDNIRLMVDTCETS